MEEATIQRLNELPKDAAMQAVLLRNMKDRTVRVTLAEAAEHSQLNAEARSVITSLLQQHRSDRSNKMVVQAARAKDGMLPNQQVSAEDLQWYTPLEYKNHYGVPVAEIRRGMESGALYAPTFYNGEPRLRHDFVEMWRAPIRPGTFAAGDGRWPMDVQFQCDRFLQYISTTLILLPDTVEQRLALQVVEDQIVAALTHAIHRTLTLDEAQHVIATFLAHFDSTLPNGPEDHVKAGDATKSFKPKLRTAPNPPRHRDPSSRFDLAAVKKQASNLISDRQKRLDIAKRGRDEYLNNAIPFYQGHPFSKLRDFLPPGVLHIGPLPDRATLVARLNQRPSRQDSAVRYHFGMSPEHYVLWCLDNGWDPRTERPLNKKPSFHELLEYMPLIFGPYQGSYPASDAAEMHRMDFFWARRAARIPWLEQAVASLADQAFWSFRDAAEASVLGREMRHLWLKEYNPFGRFASTLDKRE